MTATGTTVVAVPASATAFLIPGLWLTGAILVGALVVAVVNWWRKKANQGFCSPSEQLAQYRALYEQGALSEEEYNQLRSVLGGELRRDLGVPVPASAPPKTNPAEAPPPSEQTGIQPAQGGQPDPAGQPSPGT